MIYGLSAWLTAMLAVLMMLLSANPLQAEIPHRLRVASPHVLWKIVSERCLPDVHLHGAPAPCAVVDEAGGFAVLKDKIGTEQFLLIPLMRITGIESPVILLAGTPNFFADAWAQIPLVEARLHRTLPREDVSLAINSAYGRSQDQLHIHVDCISQAAHDALAGQIGKIRMGWTALPTSILGHHYRAMRITGEQLGQANPFHLLAASLDHPERQMGRHTLVLVGAHFPEPGFILLDDHLDLLHLDLASGEELQDHACAIAGSLPVSP